MKSTNDTRSKVFRWALLLLNGFLTIGMFHIWYGCDNSRHLMSFWVDIPDYAYYYDLKSYQKISGICLGFSTVALIFVPLLHVFKLIGVLGEKLSKTAYGQYLIDLAENHKKEGMVI